MSTSPQTPVSPRLQSEQVVREILTTQWRQEPALVVQSPPGGGKTGIVERLAIQELVLLRGRAMIATLTNAQAYDLARRLTRHYQRYLILSVCSCPPSSSTGSQDQIGNGPGESGGLPAEGTMYYHCQCGQVVKF